MLIYAALEDAVIARLQGASDANALGYRFAQVASYGGEFDDETFFTAVRKFPAAWITVGGDKPKKISAKTWQCGLKLAVMVGTRNVRGERSTRRGTISEPGSYQLAQDVRDLLVNQSLGIEGLTPLSLGPIKTLFNTRVAKEARSVLGIEFDAAYTYRQPEDDPGSYAGIDIQYYLKPGDDVADATDTVALGT